MANEPNFLELNPDIILKEWVSDYENRTGKTLQPAQPERLLIQAAAYREILMRTAIQNIAVQNLVSFATGSMLDNLGELVGVRRLAPSPATTVLKFDIVNGHGGVIIPSGTRVSTVDGLAVFTTDVQVAVPSDVFSVTVDATATVEGVFANGYQPGQIIELLDPKPYVTAVTNLTTSSRGSAIEQDEALRERIKIAPETFSTAGSRGAYEFHAKSASALIVDVAVVSPIPGTVEIYPLILGNEPTPIEILNEVSEVCNGEKVRPLTDTVLVKSPTIFEYSIEVELELLQSADAAATLEASRKSIESLAVEKASKLGRDVVVTQIIAAASVPGVYKVSVNFPAADMVVSPTEVAICTSLIVEISGTNEG